jgi:DNA polymerase III subunit delta
MFGGLKMVMEIWKQIKQKQIAPVYLLFGKESFLINETKQLLLDRILKEDEKDFNLSIYDLEETPIEVALEDAETFPFLGEKKVLFLQNPTFLTAEKIKEKVEHNLSRLEAYLKQPAPYSVLVLSAPYEKLDERKKITKELKRTAVTVEAKALNEQELKDWIRTRASYNKIEIAPDAVEQIITLVGNNLFMVTSEIDKLALYVTDTRMIDVDIVEKLVAKSLEQNIFALIDKVMDRKLDGALRIYYDLLKQNEEPIKILAVLAGHFRLIYQVKELARRGYGQMQIAGQLKANPYRVKLILKQIQKFKDEELAWIMKQLAEADYQMKTGKMDKSLLLEMFFLKLTT